MKSRAALRYASSANCLPVTVLQAFGEQVGRTAPVDFADVPITLDAHAIVRQRTVAPVEFCPAESATGTTRPDLE